ncbi:hypothetical protein LTR37_010048 [Vermiconidia calcicola]|uniref:Uncharacterized protein n=1 Tax=Vermiconidia calcicola TaxID=1690605 RepID=A0ACC3N615_9PEZI|nr:hypothetical protein LTR37_010048 [Vermiconidia calcicola]
MATSKKRKSSEVGEGGFEKAKKRQRSTKKKTITKSPDSRLMKLPGELRNEVYNLVLSGPERTFVHPSGRPMYIRNRIMEVHEGAAARWREPALLKVCKQVRSEAMAIHYSTRFFDIIASPDEFRSAYLWLKWVSEQCDEKTQLTVKIWVHNPRWEGLLSWKWLAKIASKHDLSFDRFAEISNPARPGVAQAWLSNTFNVTAALEEVVGLGQKAAKQESPDDYLESAFKDWKSSKANFVATARSRARRRQKEHERRVRSREMSL